MCIYGTFVSLEVHVPQCVSGGQRMTCGHLFSVSSVGSGDPTQVLRLS